MASAALPELPRHLKVSGVAPMLGFEPCEDPGCRVGSDGTASSCGRLACPSCGCGGTNLSTIQLAHIPFGGSITCNCGHAWVHGGLPVKVAARSGRFD